MTFCKKTSSRENGKSIKKTGNHCQLPSDELSAMMIQKTRWIPGKTNSNGERGRFFIPYFVSTNTTLCFKSTSSGLQRISGCSLLNERRMISSPICQKILK
jgi:hypothetical protein